MAQNENRWMVADPTVQQFKASVSDHAEEIDSQGHSNGQDWYSLTLGWALGTGMSVDEAHAFALFIRYHTNFG